MNWKNLFFIALVLWLITLVYFLSVSKNGQPKGPCDDFELMMLNTDTIIQQIKAYQSLLDSIIVKPKNPSGHIDVDGQPIPLTKLAQELNTLRGYQLPKCELSQIIKDHGEALDIYTMFAVNPNAIDRDTTPIKYLDMYFLVVTGNNEFYTLKGVENTLDEGYDYEKPCPNRCPF